MSLAKTMKELEAANAALEGQLAAMKFETDKAAATAADLLAKALAQAAEKDGAIKGLTDQVATAAQAADEAAKKIKALEDEKGALAADLAKKTQALANPAFADAAALGQATPPKDGGEPVKATTDEQFAKEYRAETDPEKRATMWRARQAGK